jgi:hypothetical protein
MAIPAALPLRQSSRHCRGLIPTAICIVVGFSSISDFGICTASAAMPFASNAAVSANTLSLNSSSRLDATWILIPESVFAAAGPHGVPAVIDPNGAPFIQPADVRTLSTTHSKSVASEPGPTDSAYCCPKNGRILEVINSCCSGVSVRGALSFSSANSALVARSKSFAISALCLVTTVESTCNTAMPITASRPKQTTNIFQPPSFVVSAKDFPSNQTPTHTPTVAAINSQLSTSFANSSWSTSTFAKVTGIALPFALIANIIALLVFASRRRK